MTVADARGRRWDAAAGIGFVVLGFVGFGAAGAPPKADDSSAEIAKFFVDKRDELLLGNVLLLLAALFFLWFLGALRSYLRAAEGGEGRLSAASFGGGVAGATLLLAGAAALNAAAYRATGSGADPNLQRTLFDLSNALFAMAGAGFGVFAGAASCSAARSGALPGRLVWSGSAIALLQVLTLTTLFAKSGELAAGGLISFVPATLALLWVLATSILMMRRDGVPPVTRTEP
jgi:hypothetical protein